MDTSIFTNILFSALSIFILFLTVGFVIFIIYVILVLKSLQALFMALKSETEHIAKELEDLKNSVKNKKEQLMSFIGGIASFLKKKKGKKE